MINSYVFWQDALSIHQSALLRNLAALPGKEVTLAIWEDINPQRKAAGWQRPDLGAVHVLLQPSRQVQAELLSRGDSVLQVFSGPHGNPHVAEAMKRSVKTGAHLSILSEAHDCRGVKGYLRRVRSTVDARRISGRLDAVFAAGAMGVDWFVQSGFPKSKIVSLGYFVETPSPCPLAHTAYEPCAGFVELIFVGQIIARKGWDILLQALSELGMPGWRLHVVGDGVDHGRFAETAARLGLADRVCLYGIRSSADVPGFIAQSDLLVLPSRYDGWGAVVNEALMCGTPVVCTDRCGAQDLLDGALRGEVVEAGSVQSLCSALRRRMRQGKKSAETAERIRCWSKCIEGVSAAEYFAAAADAVVAGGEKPVPPWFSKGN